MVNTTARLIYTQAFSKKQQKCSMRFHQLCRICRKKSICLLLSLLANCVLQSFMSFVTFIIHNKINKIKCLSTMRETRVQSLVWEDPLEKEMAIHSSTIAWKIPRTEEPGRLQSMGSQRVGHDWVTSLSLSILYRQYTPYFRPPGRFPAPSVLRLKAPMLLSDLAPCLLPLSYLMALSPLFPELSHVGPF